MSPTAPAQLYTGIVLYSTADPEASAMLVDGGLIAWTGPEDSARVLFPDAQVIDATGCLLTPGFVDAAAGDDAVPAASLARGIVRRLPVGTGASEGVRVITPLTEQADYRALLAEGVPLAFGSGGAPDAADPWAWVRAAAQEGPLEHRISDRAAFLAATRGGHRAAGDRAPGSLLTGEEATFVVWEPWDLTVRGQGEQFETWSTDPRSRTPLLPDLAKGSPRALRTVIGGEVVHDLMMQDAPSDRTEDGRP
ncbi:hypothetical protein M3F63_09935 [Brachybacterium muris]|uniref:hypothetical protein n=1 Tax=Brachybacterium muris TaxID=219301 RepID=UPI00223C33C4|nr:hypothetical protein [Brachybacterium muris]MCT2177977.1 hypothetical protein [Brachybacterium muris]